ncbi:hypothetical protein SAMN02799631_00644 [Methylobacterium sp. 174MFSha1.1]|uniref:hypothetical protein n=1 Tax=Methylobacterium sp. 174MFSha1.1 TaxID=1502749 RepID=UPI0008F23754|nr:hypothetical protein [Methylobacterium sp. 174MFSha1.1]SFU42817.1 hypothetical protein SAMN02799631_00644 [Methylobacterium sp. 174MFSha1.1]
MNRRSTLNMIGAVQLIKSLDTIGIAVFSARDTNQMFVAETDFDLRITRFITFYNTENYYINYATPDSHNNKRYNLGDPGPIPFWINELMEVIDGDAESLTPALLFGEAAVKESSVLADMTRILGNARDGFYKRRDRVWATESIGQQFDDVIEAPPVHSRYWVSRYRVAVATVRKLADPPCPIDNELRLSATKWLRRFGSKTELMQLSAVLGKEEDGVFRANQTRDHIFAYLTNKIALGDYRDVEKSHKLNLILSHFPDGIYNAWINQGWPKVSFKYLKPKDFRVIMKRELHEAHLTGNFGKAFNLSILLFGDTNAPKDVMEIGDPILTERVKLFRIRKDNAFKNIFPRRAQAANWPMHAKQLQEEHKRLIMLDAMIHGGGRFDLRHVEGRFGMYQSDVTDLKRYAGQFVSRSSRRS